MNTPQETRFRALLAYYLRRLDRLQKSHSLTIKAYLKERDQRLLKEACSSIKK